MTYRPKDVVKHFSLKGISIRPKKIRRIMRSTLPGKSVMRWSMTPEEYQQIIQVVETKVRIGEVIHECNNR